MKQQQRDLPLTVFKPNVQIYAIVQTSSGDYDLIGHGLLSILTDQIENETVHYLEVESVKDAELLLRSRLRLSGNYEKQRGSVIVWNDNEQKGYFDLAISFETDKECDFFWRLICQKIGKNYLQINGRDTLDLPSETNLPYILDKTKTAKDMVEYYLLSYPAFAAALSSVFKKFQGKGDKMGMGMVGRIVKSIFSNVDYKMVQVLFRDPTFELILQVQKFLHEIDFPQWWAQKVRIRSIVPLGQELTLKIHIIHRLSFYRETILDLIKESYLQRMLVMTQEEFCKEIIIHLTKENTLEELIKLTYQPAQESHVLQQKDIGEEDTFLAENQEIRRQQFAQRKFQFLLEAVIISKQIQIKNIQLKFYDKLFRSGVIEMATEYLDRGILKALDFFNCLAQSTPLKFIEYLKLKYREKPSDNLHIKLSKKYCVGSDQMQSSILEMIKNLSEGFKIKENLDFFIGTFFASVFGCCKEPRAILCVVSEVQNILENVESFFSQVMKSRVFDKLSTFLRSQKQDKSSELRAIKILKRVLLENADSSWSFKKGFLSQLNEQIIKSGFLDYCMIVLEKNVKFNNVISSSMLENIRIIRDINRFTSFHREIQNNYQQSEALSKFVVKILEVKEEKGEGEVLPFSYQRELELEQEKEQAYFMSEMPEEANNSALNSETSEQLQSLRRMRHEISLQEQNQEKEVYQLSLPSKKMKVNEQMPICIELQLPFDQYTEGDK